LVDRNKKVCHYLLYAKSVARKVAMMPKAPKIKIAEPPADPDLERTLDQPDPLSGEGSEAPPVSNGPARVGTADGGSAAMRVNETSGLDRQQHGPVVAPVRAHNPAGQQTHGDEIPLTTQPKRFGHTAVRVFLTCLALVLLIALFWVSQTSETDVAEDVVAENPEEVPQVEARVPDLTVDMPEPAPELVQTTEPVQAPEPTLPDASSCEFHSADGSGAYSRSDAPGSNGKFIVKCDDDQLYIAGRTLRKDGVWSHHDLTPVN
jgi:hypothetical protein